MRLCWFVILTCFLGKLFSASENIKTLYGLEKIKTLHQKTHHMQYRLQVGSFLNAGNAQACRDVLRTLIKAPVFLSTPKDNTRFYTVFIGPSSAQTLLSLSSRLSPELCVHRMLSKPAFLHAQQRSKLDKIPIKRKKLVLSKTSDVALRSVDLERKKIIQQMQVLHFEYIKLENSMKEKLSEEIRQQLIARKDAIQMEMDSMTEVALRQIRHKVPSLKKD